MTGAGAEIPGVIAWGAAGAALEAGASGDLHVVAPFPGGALVGVIDGLGHGPEAAVAAREAARVLAAYPTEPLQTLLERCHEALRRTRGAVASVASFDARASVMTWAGVGNVEGVLVRADRSAGRDRETILLRGGVVGYQLPAVRAAPVPVAPGDTLVLATDGVRSGFAERAFAGGTPQEIADAILAAHGRGTDDALVLVARYLGAA